MIRGNTWSVGILEIRPWGAAEGSFDRGDEFVVSVSYTSTRATRPYGTLYLSPRDVGETSLEFVRARVTWPYRIDTWRRFVQHKYKDEDENVELDHHWTIEPPDHLKVWSEQGTFHVSTIGPLIDPVDIFYGVDRTRPVESVAAPAPGSP